MTEDRVGRLSLMAMSARLSERDRQVLEHLNALRLLGARDLQALLFPDDRHATAATAARCCRRVLERLTRDRFVVRLERRIGGVRAGSASFVYTLGPLGQRVLEAGEPRRRHREPSDRFIDHTLAVAGFFVRLSLHARAIGWELIAWEAEPKSWRDVTTLGGRVVLRPDLFVTVGVGDYELRWFVEIDRGTEHLPAVQRKCRLYHSYYKGGHEQRRHKVFPRVLWVVPDQRRAERLRDLVDHDRRLTSDLFRIAVNEDAVAAIGVRE